MAAETGFTIDGTIYEVPSLDTFTMDETQVLYDYSGLALEDFMVSEEGTEESDALDSALKNPGFKRALMHISYQRGNPDVKARRVKELIGSANVIDALSTLTPEEPLEETVPLALTTEPEGSSLSGSAVSSESSGNGSETVSDVPAVPRTPIGTTRSGTSSPESPATTLAR